MFRPIDMVITLTDHDADETLTQYRRFTCDTAAIAVLAHEVHTWRKAGWFVTSDRTRRAEFSDPAVNLTAAIRLVPAAV